MIKHRKAVSTPRDTNIALLKGKIKAAENLLAELKAAYLAQLTPEELLHMHSLGQACACGHAPECGPR